MVGGGDINLMIIHLSKISIDHRDAENGQDDSVGLILCYGPNR